MVNGRTSREYYKSGSTEVEFTSITTAFYNGKEKPINIEDYAEEGIFSELSTGRPTAKYRSYDELLRIYPQVAHVLKNDYEIALSYEQAVERLKIWVESKETFKTFDIESRGTDWGPYSDNRITGVFLGFGESWSTYFPFRQDNFPYNLPIEFLREIFDAINNQPPAPEVIILAHNCVFEIQGFYQEFRDFVRCDMDTMLLSILVDPRMLKGLHSLKHLTSKADGHFYLELKDIFTGPVEFNVLPPEIVKLYGCPDATSPVKVLKYLMPKLPKDEHYVLALENKLPVIKAMNMFYGMRLDQELLNKLYDETTEDAERLSSAFIKKHKLIGSINAPATIRSVLYGQLKLKVKSWTKKHEPSVSKQTISSVIKEGANKRQPDESIKDIVSADNHTVLVKGKDIATNAYPTLLLYQAYKVAQKKIGALNRLKKKSVNGYFKFYINQSGAGSNRQTSDAHQFDDTMKRCAVADSPYHGLVSCDWKQVELRILAGLAGQKDLIELEKDPNVDIHRAILSIIQKKPMYLISEEDRKAGKSVNFGVVYMMSEYGLAAKDYGIGYTEENILEERKKITDFYTGLPDVNRFINHNKEFLRKNGYIKTMFGYYRYFPELLDPEVPEKRKKSLIRQGNNLPVQGTGAQMLKIVECNVWNYIRAKGWDKEKDYNGVKLPMVRMIVPIHDEILLSYDKTIPKEEICKMFKECMELKIEGMPPFFAAPAFIDNWYQGKDDAYEVDLDFRDKVVEEYAKGNMLFEGHDYLTVLKEFREQSLKNYMDGLIKQYHTVAEVAKHVTDDNLTHTLISNELSKSERKALTHEERIVEATRRFMDGYAIDATATEIDETENIEYYEDLDFVLDNYQVFDQEGNVIAEDPTEDDEYEDVSDIDEVPENVYVPDLQVLYTLREVLIDVSNVSEEDYQKFMQHTKESGDYCVLLIKDEQIVNTGRYINYFGDSIDAVIKEV